MTLADIRAQIMFQTSNDADDLPDFDPHLNDYINEGYDIVVLSLYRKHLDYSESATEFQPLADSEDVPDIPEWLHRALADYATWLVYRNGNPQKQQRGMAYLDAFNKALGRASRMTADQDDGTGNGPGDVFRHHLDP